MNKRYVICPDEHCKERLVINSGDEVIECKKCGTMSNIALLEIFELLDVEKEIKPQSSLNNQTAESPEKYVLCPDENCKERLVINSGDEVIDCKKCETMSNITLLEIFSLPNSQDMNQQSDIIVNEHIDFSIQICTGGKSSILDDSCKEKYRLNVLKELDIQKNRVANADKITKEQDSLMKEIAKSRKTALESKKEKRKLQSCLKEL